MSLLKLSALIEALYDAAIDANSWKGLSSRIARHFQAESCALQVQDTRIGKTAILDATANLTPKVIASYEAHYHKTDLWVARASAQGLGRIFTSSELTSNRELLASEFHEWLKQTKQFSVVGSVASIGKGTVGVIGIHRPYGAREFEESDKEPLGLLLPHLLRAMQLCQRLRSFEHGQRLALDALDSLAVGVIVVGEKRLVLFANATAERILRAGTALTARHGQLRAVNGKMDQGLQRALEDASQAAIGRSLGAGGALALPRPEARPLSLLVCPLRPGAMKIEPSQPAAMIFIGDPDRQREPSLSALAQTYNLTPAEARLTEALLEGERLQDYADRVGVSIHTAKTHLKQIFAKTGHGRQADLIRDALSNPVLRMSREATVAE